MLLLNEYKSSATEDLMELLKAENHMVHILNKTENLINSDITLRKAVGKFLKMHNIEVWVLWISECLTIEVGLFCL